MARDEDEGVKQDRTKALLRVSFALIMVLVGALTVSLTGADGPSAVLPERVGLGFIVAGIVGLFTEFAFGPYWLRARKADQCPFGTLAESGMQLMRHERIGFDGFHRWLTVLGPQEMFFAGRSVLHRMKKDFEDRGLPPIHEALIQKMKTGSKIRILFMDPKWDLIEQIASQEGRTSARELYVDLKTTCSIIGQLWERLQHSTAPLPGSIDIRVYREVSQYAYHYTKDLSGGRVEMYVGFYFAELLGWQSALFQVHSVDIQKSFERHFAVLFDRAQQLLTYPSSGGGLQRFNNNYHQEALNLLESKVSSQT